MISANEARKKLEETFKDSLAEELQKVEQAINEAANNGKCVVSIKIPPRSDYHGIIGMANCDLFYKSVIFFNKILQRLYDAMSQSTIRKRNKIVKVLFIQMIAKHCYDTI